MLDVNYEFFCITQRRAVEVMASGCCYIHTQQIEKERLREWKLHV